jgi:hypothetical protein
MLAVFNKLKRGSQPDRLDDGWDYGGNFGVVVKDEGHHPPRSHVSQSSWTEARRLINLANVTVFAPILIK